MPEFISVEEEEGCPVEGLRIFLAHGGDGLAVGGMLVATGEPMAIKGGHEEGRGAVVDRPETHQQ